jgi:hypothetical protein
MCSSALAIAWLLQGDAMQAAMKSYDSDLDLKLNRDEFVEFARSLVKDGAISTCMLHIL